MRNLTVFMLASIVAVTGCDMLKKKTDEAATPEASVAEEEVPLDAAPPDSTPVTAANAAAVARFATETPLDEDRVIATQATPRTSPGGANIVATLKVGTQVERIATNGKDSLIQFQDPSNPTVTLMGWVTDAAFTSTVVPHKKVDAGADSGAVAVATADAGAPATVVDAGAAPFACPPGKTAILSAAGKNECHKSCTINNECKNKQCSTATALKGGQAKVCLGE
ncbi:MAG: hypothetical protein KIT84_43655 [Labilithrix sp.]|nr:hypothetical protein [Labilithrix sp.]MCW5817976.1 hypothetical protein [Labilithrix sp.]